VALGTEIHLASASCQGCSRAWTSTGGEWHWLYCGQPLGWEIGGSFTTVFSGISQTNSENPLYKADSVMLLSLQETR